MSESVCSGSVAESAKENDVEQLALIVKNNKNIQALVNAHRDTALALFKEDATASQMKALRKKNLSAMLSSMPLSPYQAKLYSSSLSSILEDLLYKSEEEAMLRIGTDVSVAPSEAEKEEEGDDIAELAHLIKDNTKIHELVNAHRITAFALFKLDAPASKMLALRNQNLSSMISSMSLTPSQSSLLSSSLSSILQDLLYKSEDEAMKLIQIVNVHREAALASCKANAPASGIIALRMENVEAMEACMSFASMSRSELQNLLIETEESVIDEMENELGSRASQRDHEQQEQPQQQHQQNQKRQQFDSTNNNSRGRRTDGDFGKDGVMGNSRDGFGGDSNGMNWDNNNINNNPPFSPVTSPHDLSTMAQTDKAPRSNVAEFSELTDFLGDRNTQQHPGRFPSYNASGANDNGSPNNIMGAYGRVGDAAMPATHFSPTIPSEIRTDHGPTWDEATADTDGNSCMGETIASDVAVGMATVRGSLPPSAFYNALEHRAEEDEEEDLLVLQPQSSFQTTGPRIPSEPLNNMDHAMNFTPATPREPLETTDAKGTEPEGHDATTPSDILASIYGQSDATNNTAGDPSASVPEISDITTPTEPTNPNTDKTESSENEKRGMPSQLQQTIQNEALNIFASFKAANGKSKSPTETTQAHGAVPKAPKESPLDLGRTSNNNTSTAMVEASSPYPAAIRNLMDALSPFYNAVDSPSASEILLGRRHSNDAHVATQAPPSAKPDGALIGRRHSSDAPTMHQTSPKLSLTVPTLSSKSLNIVPSPEPKPLTSREKSTTTPHHADKSITTEDALQEVDDYSSYDILSSIYSTADPPANGDSSTVDDESIPRRSDSFFSQELGKDVDLLRTPSELAEDAGASPASESKQVRGRASKKHKKKKKGKKKDANRHSTMNKQASFPPPEREADTVARNPTSRSSSLSRRSSKSMTVDDYIKKALDITSSPGKSTENKNEIYPAPSRVPQGNAPVSMADEVSPQTSKIHENGHSDSNTKQKALEKDASDVSKSKKLPSEDIMSRDEARIKNDLKGIEYKESTGVYHTRIYYRATIHRLGEYELACDAALAYDEAVRLLKDSSSSSSDLTLNFRNKNDYLTLRSVEMKTRGVDVDLKTALSAMSLPIKEVKSKIQRRKSKGVTSKPRPPPRSAPSTAPVISDDSSIISFTSATGETLQLTPTQYSALNKNESSQSGSSKRNQRRSHNESDQSTKDPKPINLDQKLSPPDPTPSHDGNRGSSLRRKDPNKSRRSSQGSTNSHVSWATDAGERQDPPSSIYPSNNTNISKVSGSLSDHLYVNSQNSASSHTAKETKISRLSGSLSDHLYVGTQSTLASTKDQSHRSSNLSTIMSDSERSDMESTVTSPMNQGAFRNDGSNGMEHNLQSAKSNSMFHGGGGGSTSMFSENSASKTSKNNGTAPLGFQGGSMGRSQNPGSQPVPFTSANGQLILPDKSHIPTDASFEHSTIRSSSSCENGNNLPKFKLSWSNESQSAAMTGRSQYSTTVAQTHNERDGSKAIDERLWASFAWIITFPITNRCIPRPTKAAKQAWREKVALFFAMVATSLFCVGVLGFVPLLLCDEDIIFSEKEIWLQTGESWVIVHGVIYDIKDFIYKHPGGVQGIGKFLGQDASRLFPRAPPVTLPQKCLDMEKVTRLNMMTYSPENNFTNPVCPSLSDMDVLLGVDCHTFAAGANGTYKFLGEYERGILSVTSRELNDKNRHWFSLYDRVYDVTDYINSVNMKREWINGEQETDLSINDKAYLTPTMNKVIIRSLGTDATRLYESLFGSVEYIGCLEMMFYSGVLDDDFDMFCYTLNIMMYCMLIFVSTLMVVQFLASMIYICPRHRTYSDDDVMSPVMIKVPCYCEGDNELRKTIKSVFNTSYPDENKVLVMVADGLITGDGEDMSTPDHLANLLGFDIDEFEDDTFEYDCIGVFHSKNRARVYHGVLQKGFKFLKYIVIIKCGLPAEPATSSRPGNRGKRDSQLIMIGFFNRIHYGRELTELDCAIQRAMMDLNLQADMIRFLMAIDADTRVDSMALTHMVYHMNKKEKVIALCGETKVDNKSSSWVTMIQVFEYYSSHHLKKAFEAAFGCVTCLPGCFTMYRIISDDGTPLLPGDGVMYEYSRNDIETLHEKNLYHLGEDRLLTTLLLQYYPDRSLTFIPEAVCWTIVPHTFKILLSQRRRWINSTVHNMFELLRVKTLCGISCFSMKIVVFIDLIATMILPASYVYAMFLLFLVFFDDLPVSTVLLVLYAVMMGCQVAVFILRSRWEYVWWFFIYFTAGLPVFYFILPLWSFWNMDDFSWGKTRAVTASAGAGDSTQENDGDDVKELKKFHEGYSSLTTDDTTPIPSIVQDDMRSTSVCSSISGQEIPPHRRLM